MENTEKLRNSEQFSEHHKSIYCKTSRSAKIDEKFTELFDIMKLLRKGCHSVDLKDDDLMWQNSKLTET